MYQTAKRLFDVAAAIAGLLATGPLMAIIAVMIRVSMGSPVLFRQRRPGLHEVLFTCLKFRTMTDERDADGNLLSDSNRMTGLGLLLRQTSLDELPQLWNILKGQLSFVGPRPLLESYIPYYLPHERQRHSVRPGLTGWAQIHGRNYVDFSDRLAMDVWYVDHASMSLDLRILCATIWITLTRKGFAADQPFLPLDVQRRSQMCAEGQRLSSERD